MRLIEAIVEANHRAIAGDTSAGVHPGDFETELPVVALTCVDPRLNALFPDVLGLPGDQFIWLRNAGNIITGPLSNTTRSLALACAVKNGREIAIIGHTDCQVRKTTTMQLLEQLKKLGIERDRLPDNISEFFGMFGSEQQNVIKACQIIRHSPLISPKVAVHGMLVDIETGRLEWIVNGYENWGATSERWNDAVKSAGQAVDSLKSMTDFKIGEMKFPETKIGEAVTKAGDWMSAKIQSLETKPGQTEYPILEKAGNVAEKVVDYAEKHWPKPGEGKPPIQPGQTAPPPIRPKVRTRREK